MKSKLCALCRDKGSYSKNQHIAGTKSAEFTRECKQVSLSGHAIPTRYLPMKATNSAVDALNSLLRGELSATETYQQALAKEPDASWASDLKRFHADHRTTANELRKHIHELGGQPDQGSGAWGAFA